MALWDVTLRWVRVQDCTVNEVEAGTPAEAERIALTLDRYENEWRTTMEVEAVVEGRTRETYGSVCVDAASAGDMCEVLDRLLTAPALGDAARSQLVEMRRRLTLGPRSAGRPYGALPRAIDLKPEWLGLIRRLVRQVALDDPGHWVGEGEDPALVAELAGVLG
jgi:hypothetical protein